MGNIPEISAVLGGHLVDHTAHMARFERSLGEIQLKNPYSVGTPPTALMFTQARNILHNPMVETGAKIITVPDLRWKRRDIKSVSMLAQVLAKQAAIEAGAFEAWMVEDGYVTEGSSTTAFIITRGRQIVTRPLSHSILPGITS
jgi:D-alanine transaminase